MIEPAHSLIARVRRRRRIYQLLEVVIVAGLLLSGLLGYLMFQGSEQALIGIESSITLSIAAVCIFVVPLRDLRRIEAVIDLASQHGGTLTTEDVQQSLHVPEEKALTLLRWLVKRGMAERKATTGRWVFPELRKRH